VTCSNGKVSHGTWKRDVNEEAVDPFPLQFFPSPIRGPGVTREKESHHPLIFNEIAYRRNRMIHSVGNDGMFVQLDRLADFQRDELQNAVLDVRDLSEIRPDRTVEKVLLNRSGDRGDGDERDPVLQVSGDDIVGKKRNAHDVVKVSVRNEDMLDRKLVFLSQDMGQASGVEQDFMIEQKA